MSRIEKNVKRYLAFKKRHGRVPSKTFGDTPKERRLALFIFNLKAMLS